jgi:hypothetical protein
MPKTVTIVCLALVFTCMSQTVPPGMAAASERFRSGPATGPAGSEFFRAETNRVAAASARAATASVPKTEETEATREAVSDEGGRQEDLCANHLGRLRELFLNTRRLASQRAVCSLAESAAAFLDVIAMCKRDCPSHTMEHNGYTPRVIRYITSLQKIGEERCRDVLSVPQPLPPDGPLAPEAVPSAPPEPH